MMDYNTNVPSHKLWPPLRGRVDKKSTRNFFASGNIFSLLHRLVIHHPRFYIRNPMFPNSN